ncbi:hypothetical protein BOO92_19560 [Vibrio navarrensis]|nr:hypothetical protein [Vibrio navarrensis]MBH9739996.1 hypothetical protein [Vibrio navarrensis]
MLIDDSPLDLMGSLFFDQLSTIAHEKQNCATGQKTQSDGQVDLLVLTQISYKNGLGGCES